MNHELEKLLHDIDELKHTLDKARPLINEHILQTIDIEYTYDSNRIEGNTLTLRETDIVVNKGLTIDGKSIREHLEANNHYEAIVYIRNLAAEIHERIATIHPFINGNGRTARLIMNLTLLQNGDVITNIPGDTILPLLETDKASLEISYIL